MSMLFDDFESFALDAGAFLDAVGVIVILTGVALSTLMAVAAISKYKTIHDVYKSYRYNLARSILIGLEFLVAGDIIRTVAGDLTFDSVIILGVIVIIRTIISLQFETEIEGSWPWKRGKNKQRV